MKNKHFRSMEACIPLKVVQWVVLLTIAYLAGSAGSLQAQVKYYWVGNTGNWNDLSKWSNVSGGAGFRYTKPPSEKDTVIFDQNSFTIGGRRVVVNVPAVCATMDWSDAITNRSGANAGGPGIALNSSLLVTTKLELNPSMQAVNGSGSITLGNSNGGNTDVNFAGVFVGASGGVIFLSNGGAINLRGDIVADWTWVYFRGGQISTHGYSLFVRNIVSDGTTPRTINLGSSTISTQRLELGSVSATHVFNAGSSDITLRNLSANHNWISIGSGIALNRLTLTAGDAWPVASGTGTSVRVLQINENTSFRGPMLVNESLTLAPGKTLSVVDNGLTMGAGSVFNLTGDCANRPYLRSSTGSTARVNLGGAVPNISFAFLENIRMVSPSPVVASSSIDLGGNVNIDFGSSIASRVFYWRTGSGYWNDVSRWSFSGSSGPVAGCVPGPEDDVVFDNNAFTGSGDTVKISGLVSARNVDFSAANGNPVVYGGPPFNFNAGVSYYAPYSPTTVLTINGSLTLSRNVKWDLNQAVRFTGSGSHTITSAGNGFGHNVVFDGRGTYTLVDSLWVRGSSPNQTIFTSGGLFVNAGSFVTGGNKVIARSFISNTSIPKTIDLGNSELLLNEKEGPSNNYWSTFDVRNNVSTRFSNAVIRIRSEGVNRVQFNFAVPARIGTLIVEDSAAFPTSASILTFADGATVDRLRIMSSITIQGAVTINEQLALREGTYRFQPGKTITFGANAVIENIPSRTSCESFISLDADGSGTYTFRKTSGVLSVQNATINNNIANGGADFLAVKSVLNNSTGWQNSAATGRVLYWVGNGGDWKDQSHWSLSSGGPGGQCIPSALDSVVFDRNSFTIANQTVSITDGSYYVRGLNAEDVSLSSTISGGSSVTMFNSGSMNISSLLRWQVLGTLVFNGTANHAIDIKSSFSARLIQLSGSGSYTVVSDLLAVSGTIVVNSGTFTVMPGKVLSISAILSTTSVPRRIVFSGATLITQGDLRTPFSMEGSGLSYDFSNSTYFLRNNGGWFPQINAPGFRFSRVVLEGRVLEISRPGSFDVLDLRTSIGSTGVVFGGNITINDSIMFKPGGSYTFAAASVLTIADTADILTSGTSTAFINFNSSVNGSQFVINKLKDLSRPEKAQLCVDYVSVRNSRIQTGPNNVVFKTNTEWQDLGNNTGWVVAAASQPGAGSLDTLNRFCRANTSLTISGKIDQGSFPMDIVIRNVTYNTYDTIKGLTGAGFPLRFSITIPKPAGSSVYRLEQIGVYRCDAGEISYSGPFNELSYTAFSNTGGVWTNATGNSAWDSCSNWSNGLLPDQNVDVTTTIPTGLDKTIVLPAGVRRVRNLTLGAGVTLQFSAGAVLEVYGNLNTHSTAVILLDSSSNGLVIRGAWARNGAVVSMRGASSYVSFKGTSPQVVPSGSYNNIVVDNASGVSLAANTAVTLRNLQIITGASMNLNSGSVLTVTGLITRLGTWTLHANSRLVMKGNAQQFIPDGAYGILEVDNSAGIALLGNTSATTSLVLTNGILTTGSNVFSVTNTAASAISGGSQTSYVSGRLQRAIQSNTSTYAFPVGISGRYHPLELVNANLTGVRFLTTSVAPKVGSDAGMNVSEGALTYRFVASEAVWTITPDIQPTGGSYSLRCYFGNSPATVMLLRDNEFAIVKRGDASVSALDWNTGSGTLSALNGLGRKVSDGYALRTGLRSFSQFGIAYTNSALLPISLSKFSAVRMNDHVKVSWTTENETRNKYFEVERSTDGVSFTSIAKVDGAFNSYIRRTYAIEDKNAPSTKLYYRLKSVDDLGLAEYSKLAVLAAQGNPSIQVKINPNPVSSVMVVRLENRRNQTYRAMLTDGQGRVVMRFSISSSEMQVSVDGLKNGVYYLKLLDDMGQQVIVERLLISK